MKHPPRGIKAVTTFSGMGAHPPAPQFALSGPRVEGNTVRFWLRVKPCCSRQELTRTASGELSLCLHAPPVDDAANAACIEFLARWLRLPKSHIRIEVGARSRRKLIRVEGGEAVARQLLSVLSRAKERPAALPGATHEPPKQA